MLRFIVFTGYSTMLSLFGSAGLAGEVSNKEACDLLIRFASEELSESSDSGSWYCGSIDAQRHNGYFVIDLHRTSTNDPPNWVGSDLAGWYAIRTSDTP